MAIPHVQIQAAMGGAEIDQRLIVGIADREHGALRVGAQLEGPALWPMLPVEHAKTAAGPNAAVTVPRERGVELLDVRPAPLLHHILGQIEGTRQLARQEDELTDLDEVATLQVGGCDAGEGAA